MAESSAGRPLLLPEDRIEALIRSFAAGAIRQYIGTSDILGFLRDEGGIIERFSSEEEIAPLVSAISVGMNGIAEAVESGAVLAPSAEHREEWGLWLSGSPGVAAGVAWDQIFDSEEEAREQAAFFLDHGWTVARPVRRDAFTGPWVEVDGSETDG